MKKILMSVALPGMSPKNDCRMKPKGCDPMMEYFFEEEYSLHFAQVPVESVLQEESIRAAPWVVCFGWQEQLIWFLSEEQLPDEVAAAVAACSLALQGAPAVCCSPPLVAVVVRGQVPEQSGLHCFESPVCFEAFGYRQHFHDSLPAKQAVLFFLPL